MGHHHLIKWAGSSCHNEEKDPKTVLSEERELDALASENWLPASLSGYTPAYLVYKNYIYSYNLFCQEETFQTV